MHPNHDAEVGHKIARNQREIDRKIKVLCSRLDNHVKKAESYKPGSKTRLKHYDAAALARAELRKLEKD